MILVVIFGMLDVLEYALLFCGLCPIPKFRGSHILGILEIGVLCLCSGIGRPFNEVQIILPSYSSNLC